MSNENSFALNENKCKNICQRGKFWEKHNQQKITQEETKNLKRLEKFFFKNFCIKIQVKIIFYIQIYSFKLLSVLKPSSLKFELLIIDNMVVIVQS